MKKTFLISLLTLLGLAQCVWAVNETIDLSTKGFFNGETVGTVNGTDCAISFALGTNTNNLSPRYYINGNAVRVYCGNWMTVSSDTKTIEQITLVFGTGDKRNEITVDKGSFSVDTWTGNANEVVFSVEGSSGHRRIQQVEVTYVSSVATPVISGTSPFTGSTEVSITAEEGATIYYTTNGTKPTSSSNRYSSAFTINQSLTVQAIAIKGDETSNVASMVFAKVVPVWTGSGTKADPYLVTSSDVLDMLARLVNDGESYAGKYFKQTANISYKATSAWNDTSSEENNFTPVGSASKPFKGNYDGNGYTISGIRIYGGNHTGLFGKTDGGTIRNVTLADTRITAGDRTGGIVGMKSGTMEQCHVKADVCIHAPSGNTDDHGGVVGLNYTGLITACTSEATLSIAKNITTGCAKFGGIVGNNSGSIINCLAVNVKLPSTNLIRTQNSSIELGAIVGNSSSTSGCLYHGCTVGGATTASGIGKMMSDAAGAEPGHMVTCGTEGLSLVPDADDTKDLVFYGEGYLYDGKIYATNGKILPIELIAQNGYPFVNVATTSGSITGSGNNYTLTLGNEDAVITADMAIVLSDAADNTDAIAEGAAIAAEGKTVPVVLSGRTFYKNGKWNTLCLPFGIDDFTGTELEDATVMKLDSEHSGFDASTGTLTLNFEVATQTVAGHPYIVKWETTGEPLKSPIFYGVTISNGVPAGVTSKDGYVTFVGLYSPFSTEGEDATKLYLGHDNTLYYPSSKMTIGSFRAYFQLLGGLTAGEPENGKQGIRAFELNFGEETGIHSISEDSVYPEYSERSEYSVTWYSLDGCKLMQKPTQKGMYIGGGRKVMIK